MCFRRVGIILFAALFALGCNTDPRARRETALLRAEILDLEDKYYLLKSKYQDALGRLGETEPELMDGYPLESEVILEGPTVIGDPVIYDHQTMPMESYSMPLDSYPSSPVQPYPSSPVIEAPTPAEVPLGETSRSLDLEELKQISTSGNRVPSRSNQVANGTNYGQQITEVVINRAASGGQNVDQYPGDDGVNLLIQTRTANGQNLLQAGELVVKLIDPSMPRGKQVVGSWQFLRNEVPLFFANDELQRQGILLHLPWESRAPRSSKLIVNVQFQTQDGRVLTSSGDFRISIPTKNYSPNTPAIANWTQTDSRWVSAGETLSGRDLEYVRNENQTAPNPPATKRIRAIPAKAIQTPQWRPTR
ncbi:MAG: hypothetical protein AAF939_15620 [Planctomycetota bacterium]